MLFRMRALVSSVEWDGKLGRAFEKAVRRKPLWGAADAGLMQNESSEA